MGFVEVGLLVVAGAAMGVACAAYLSRRQRRFPVTAKHKCVCGVKIEVSGYSEEVTRRVIERVRQIHSCEGTRRIEKLSEENDG